MAKGSVKVDVTAPERAARKTLKLYMDIAKREMLMTARREVPKDTTALEQSLRIQNDGDLEMTIVSDLEYAEHVIQGTGVHGPRRRPITPRRAQALRFRPKGSGEYVFAASVQGSRPNDFPKRTVEMEQPRQGTYMEQAASVTRRTGPD